ncbi:YczE/YyaS/YitT family protein [Micromonospora sp. LOL_023]|uniref:membrane protein YczE n=1 Tax=Micromonospora sp. LOL_023 TaxID=3345418 RepID=UPI003A8B60BB
MKKIGNGGDRLPRRLGQLYLGLVLYGVSMALMIEPHLGLNPWDVFHQGLAGRTGLSFGTVTVITGAAVLLLWIPLRQRPGLGTVSNVVVIGIAVDAALAVLPSPTGLPVRIGWLIAGVVLNGLATGLYIGARFGPGPRDGLMTGWVTRHPGSSVRLVRTVIEVTVLGTGWLLGGTVGLGTVLYALCIGPLAQFFLPLCSVEPRRTDRPQRPAQPRRSVERPVADPELIQPAQVPGQAATELGPPPRR